MATTEVTTRNSEVTNEYAEERSEKFSGG